MLHLLAGEETEVGELASLLRSDPALSSELLAVANSSFYGSRYAVDNLARAILLPGFERARSLTLAVALRSFTSNPANPQVMQACWQHSMASALIAQELAPLYEIPKDHGYTAGLIHDVGRLGLLTAHGERYTAVFATPHETLAACLESERRLFEMDHCQAGFLLTQRWGFPSEYSRVAGCHHGEMPAAKQDLVALAHTACSLADALGFPAVIILNSPATAEIVAQLPATPWRPYTFCEERMKDQIAAEIKCVRLA
jgi:HD-like signal output (HDOD) protein